MKNRIREARQAKQWTQRRLADEIGTTPQTVQRYESGERDIRGNTLITIAKALDVSIGYLISTSIEYYAIDMDDYQSRLIAAFEMLDVRCKRALVAAAEAMASEMTEKEETR